jgi:membrane protease YdiL (CAAX protease family)
VEKMRAQPGVRHPIAAYCLLAFAITWGAKYLQHILTADGNIPAFNAALIGRTGPSIAALLLVWWTVGGKGLRTIGSSLVDARPGWPLLTFAASFEVIFFSAITATDLLFSDRPRAVQWLTVGGAIPSLVGTFITGIILWGLPEEIGWRGWMLPKLQDRFPPFTASLILAAVATLWHLDPWKIPDIASAGAGLYLPGRLPDAVERLIITVPFTLVITWFYNRTGGSLLAMIFFHSGSNTAYFWMEDVFGDLRSEFFQSGFLVGLIVIGVLFSILVLRQRGKAVTGTDLFRPTVSIT